MTFVTLERLILTLSARTRHVRGFDATAFKG
jgi:hypothetical protein